MSAVMLGDVSWQPFLFLESPWGGSIFLGESQSRIYPNMCAKFGCGPTIVSKKGGGTDRETRDTAALYSRCRRNPCSYNVCELRLEPGGWRITCMTHRVGYKLLEYRHCSDVTGRAQHNCRGGVAENSNQANPI